MEISGTSAKMIGLCALTCALSGLKKTDTAWATTIRIVFFPMIISIFVDYVNVTMINQQPRENKYVRLVACPADY